MIKFLFFVITLSLSYLIYRLVSSSSLKKKNIIIINTAIFLSTIIFMILFYLFSEENINKNYNPPAFDGEKIVPGYFGDDKK